LTFRWSAAAALTEAVVSGTWAPLGRVTSSPVVAWGLIGTIAGAPNHWASGAAEAAATVAKAAAATAFMVIWIG